MALAFWRQIGGEAECLHALYQDLSVGGKTGSAGGDAPFRFQLLERLPKRQQGMGGGRESELPVRFQSFPLREEIEAEAAGAALGGSQKITPRQHKAKARNPLDALVRRRNQKVDVARGQVDGNASKAAHSIHEKNAAQILHYMADLGAEFIMPVEVSQ